MDETLKNIVYKDICPLYSFFNVYTQDYKSIPLLIYTPFIWRFYCELLLNCICSQRINLRQLPCHQRCVRMYYYFLSSHPLNLTIFTESFIFPLKSSFSTSEPRFLYVPVTLFYLSGLYLPFVVSDDTIMLLLVLPFTVLL